MRTASKPLRYRQGVRPGAAVVQTSGAGGLYQLYPSENSILYHIRTDEVVVMGVNPRLNWYEAPSSAHREEARRLLEQIGLGNEADRDFLTLSEGQKQLALLCRALMQNAP